MITFGPISKFILFGGGNILVHTVDSLLRRKKEVRVCAAPRHLDETPPAHKASMRALLAERNIPVLELTEVNGSKEILDWIDSHSMGLGFGPSWIFDREICARFADRFVNFMGIRMPHYMGGAHYTWQILRGNRLGAVNLQQITPKLNVGPILYTREYVFSDCRIPEDFFRVAAREEAAAMEDFLSQVESGASFPERLLDKNFEMFYPYLNTERHGWVDWGWKASEIASFMQAFDRPYLGASALHQGQRVFFHGALNHPDEGSFHPFQSGMVYRNSSLGLFIAAREGAVLVREVTDRAGNRLPLTSFKTGTRFFTPREKLEEAMLFDASYGGAGLKTNT